MARLNLTDARNLMLKSRPWTFRMEFQGPNPQVKSGWSNKFWLATGRAQNEPVEIHFGDIWAPMNQRHILVKDWAYVERTAPEKVAKGYTYADTPFVRVQPSTIAGAANTQPPPPKPVAPAQVQAPVAVQAPAVPKPPSIPVGTILPPGPWGKIVAVLSIPGGNWVGLDAQGRKVMGLTKDGARRLVQDYPHIQVTGL